MRGTGRVVTVFLFLSLLPFLHSCSRVEPHFSVLKGNSAYRKGDYQEANIESLRVQENGEYGDYISFNLGVVYNALGESEAALDEWQRILVSRNGSLYFRTIFNLGTLYYRQGRYEDAYRSFRKAVELDPGSIPAKINLEYAIAKLQAKGKESDKRQGVMAGSGRLSEDVTRVLEYVQRSEGQAWKAPDSVSRPEETMDW